MVAGALHSQDNTQCLGPGAKVGMDSCRARLESGTEPQVARPGREQHSASARTLGERSGDRDNAYVPPQQISEPIAGTQQGCSLAGRSCLRGPAGRAWCGRAEQGSETCCQHHCQPYTSHTVMAAKVRWYAPTVVVHRWCPGCRNLGRHMLPHAPPIRCFWHCL